MTTPIIPEVFLIYLIFFVSPESDRTPRRTNSSTLICSINTQCLGQVMGREWVATWTTWTTFCWPDLVSGQTDYLRFTENSGSNIQKFMEIMWCLILWVLLLDPIFIWSMYWKWTEPNAKDTMNHWTQSVAQFEIQFWTWHPMALSFICFIVKSPSSTGLASPFPEESYRVGPPQL